jgi:hypothetical protein
MSRFSASSSAVKRETPSSPHARRAGPAARSDAPALPLIDHGHGRLGGVRAVRPADEPGDADAVTGLRLDGGERLVVVMVDLGEVGDVGLAELRHRREEALVARFGAEPREAGEQALAVVRPHRAHHDPGAVAQGDGAPGVRGAGHDS